MSSTYFLVRRLDTSGGWGANFIVRWESAKSVTDPLIEAIHMGAAGPNSYAFDSRGKVIKGINE